MTTIYDIASAAGVSPATVSRALNNTGYVSEATKQKVLKIAEELGYAPNAAARSLVEKKTRMLALILPDISNPFFARMVRGIDDVVSNKGYSLIICNSDGLPYREKKYIKVLREKRVDGLILIASSKESIDRNSVGGIPLVVVDRHIDTTDVDFIFTDNVGGAEQATNHLIGLGHKVIAIITGPLTVSTGVERFKGFRNAMLEAGLKIDPNLVYEGDFQEYTGYQIGKSILNRANLPSAVFVANDLMALGLMMSLKEGKIDIPGDIAIVGYDGISETNHVEPQLTTVVQPNYEMGQAAGEQLVWRIENKNEPAHKIILPPRLLIRDSSLKKERLVM